MTHLLNTYNRAGPAFVRGEGAWLFTQEGEAWLDCVSGIATNALGHCHPRLVAVLAEQAQRLWHVSNMFHVPGQEALAQRLTKASFADLVFFTNSGTEAIECALKMVRRYHAANGESGRINIIGFEGSFHGRTHAALSAAGNAAYLEGCGPALPGYRHLALGDQAALLAAIGDPATAAVIIEPVQGEGGARAIAGEMLAALRAASTAHGVLLIYDEVQCGMGRTGTLFAYEQAVDAVPDIMTLAKALGSGFPVGACLATAQAARGMTPGSHGTTFGGNPLAMAVALAAFEEIAAPETIAHVRRLSDHLRGGLARLAAAHPGIIREVRGLGLLIGVQLKSNNRAFMAAAREQRLLVAGGGDNCVRLLPPLTLRLAEADELLDRLDRTCASKTAQVVA